MHKVLLLFLLCSSLSGLSQTTDKSLIKMQQDIERQRKSLDSSMKASDSILAAGTKTFDSANMAREMEQNNKNLNLFMLDYQERERAARKRMWWRLGFGIVLLGVGIYGVLRKRKPR